MKIKFDMISLFVSNLDQMVKFYRDIVGLDINWHDGDHYVEFIHEGIRFSMFERKMLPDLLGQEAKFPNGINGTFELAINVGDPKNVDTKFNTMVHMGAKAIYAPRNEPWKIRSALVCDPDGNMIEIASDFWD